MDGLTLLRELRMLLSESSSSSWPDVKNSYDFLFQAAIATEERAHFQTAEQQISTVANQRNYRLSYQFLSLYLKDNQNRYFIKYNDGSGGGDLWVPGDDSFIFMSSMDAITLANQTESVPIPYSFAIRDRTPDTRKSAAASSTEALTEPYTIFGQSLGEALLKDSDVNFSEIYPGDIVHNLTDLSHGIVIAPGADTYVNCAIFDGTNNKFTSGDGYLINPQAYYELYLDPPPKYSQNLITIYYIRKPIPVYSAYRSYAFPFGYSSCLSNYAAWLYKYRDREPNFGDAFYKYWDLKTRTLKESVNRSKVRRDFGVNMMRRADRSWTFR